MPDRSGPHGILFDKYGQLWVSLEFSGHIVQLDEYGNIAKKIDLWKPDFVKRHEDDFMLDPVVITDDEFTAAEFRIPADTKE